MPSESVGPDPSIPVPLFKRTATRGVSGSMERTLTASSGSIAMVTRGTSCLGVEVSGPAAEEVLGFEGRSRISACCDRTHDSSEPESSVAQVDGPGWSGLGRYGCPYECGWIRLKPLLPRGMWRMEAIGGRAAIFEGTAS